VIGEFSEQHIRIWLGLFIQGLKVPGCPENLSKIYSIILKWQLFV
jgi:hypothetical protein